METPQAHRVRYVRRRDRAFVASLPAIYRSLLHAALSAWCRYYGQLSVGNQQMAFFNKTLLVSWSNIGGVLYVHWIEDCGFHA
jgi:hypothetical protein